MKWNGSTKWLLPGWRFWKTLASRLRVYGRKLRRPNFLEELTRKRLLARGFRIRALRVCIVLAFSCKRAKTIMTIEIRYVWTRSFFEKGGKNHRFSKISGYVWTGPHTKCARCLMQPLLVTSIVLWNDFCIFTVMDLPTRKINYWKFDRRLPRQSKEFWNSAQGSLLHSRF